MQNFLFIILGLIFLIAGGNWLLKSAVALSMRLNIPKIVIGMTVVSLATSAPELLVSIKAAMEGFPDLALGNVVGSNIAVTKLFMCAIAIRGVARMLACTQVGFAILIRNNDPGSKRRADM